MRAEAFYLRYGRGDAGGLQADKPLDPPDRSDKNAWPHPVIAEGRFICDRGAYFATM